MPNVLILPLVIKNMHCNEMLDATSKIKINILIKNKTNNKTYVVKFVVKAASIADWVTILIPSPQSGR